MRRGTEPTCAFDASFSFFFFVGARQVISFDPDESNLDELAGYAVAVAGLYYQVRKEPRPRRKYGAPLSPLCHPRKVKEGSRVK